MGVYFSQALTVSGAAKELSRFLDTCIRKDSTGKPLNIDYEKIIPYPEEAITAQQRETWERENWGNPSPLDFTVDTGTDGQLVIRLSAKGEQTFPAMKHMARSFPLLQFRFASVDDGYLQTYTSCIISGKVSEVRGEVTDDFIAEVEGQPTDINGLNEAPPATPRPWPTTHIRYWFAERKIRAAIHWYPVYAPPFPGTPAALTPEQAEANFRHFMTTRKARVEQLRQFLKRFGVVLDVSDSGIRRLDRWIKRYGGFLALHERDVLIAHTPEWQGPWAVNNVMFDLATFLGEVLIQRNSGSHWELYEVPVNRRKSKPGHQEIVIRGSNPAAPWRIWVFERIASVCWARREQSFMWKKPFMRKSPPDAMNRPIKYILTQATEWNEHQ
ncbi:hypothetical protein NTJ56_20855 [Burkholderia contaminans]|uniref:hypothetical protein n=1 Tax=Burkholderia contaminans TaxID=488447 RepID=UPI001CF22736|nr:hypothetical protein [Burkholderia contaminans]MCA7915709.1 hypothetical protein [Burkholderia contaminans]UUX40888.1 hypothetical protein NTJ56_20855 [Burkholderia contaminans]